MCLGSDTLAVVSEAVSILSAVADHVGDNVVGFDDLLDWSLEHTSLAADAIAAGAEPATHLDDVLIDSGLFLVLGDDVRRLDVLLDSAVFSHRLSLEEVEADSISMIPDLMVLDWDNSDSFSTPTGDQVVVEQLEEIPLLIGPSGWLGGFGTGDVVVVRRERGVLTVEPAETFDDPAPVVALMRETFDLASQGQATVPVEDVVLTLLATTGDAFRVPTLPIGDLIASAELATYRGLIGEAGTDFGRAGGEPLDEVVGPIAQRWGMDECCVDALFEVIDATGTPVTDARRICELLGHSAVALGFRDWLRHKGLLGDEQLAAWLDDVVEGAGRRAAPALVVRAALHEAAHDVLAAERDLENAHAFDRDFAAASFELATYLIMRSEYHRAVTMLNRVGGEGSAIAELFGDAQMDAGDTGRNDPCPCGSGRKFKQCHLGKPLTTPEASVQSLMAKLRMFVTNPASGEEFAMLTLIAAGGSQERLLGLFDDPILQEVSMFEGEGLSNFLSTMGPLLAEQEREVLSRWADSNLTILEVVESSVTGGGTVVDTLSGERVSIRGQTLPSVDAPGALLAGRLLWLPGGAWTTGSTVPIGVLQADELRAALTTDANADAIAGWYGAFVRGGAGEGEEE